MSVVSFYCFEQENMVSVPQIAFYGAFAQFVPARGLQIKWQPFQGKMIQSEKKRKLSKR